MLLIIGNSVHYKCIAVKCHMQASKIADLRSSSLTVWARPNFQLKWYKDIFLELQGRSFHSFLIRERYGEENLFGHCSQLSPWDAVMWEWVAWRSSSPFLTVGGKLPTCQGWITKLKNLNSLGSWWHHQIFKMNWSCLLPDYQLDEK